MALPQFRLKSLLAGAICAGLMMWLNFEHVIVGVAKGNNETGVMFGNGFPLSASLWFSWKWEPMPAGLSARLPVKILPNGKLNVHFVDENAPFFDPNDETVTNETFTLEALPTGRVENFQGIAFKWKESRALLSVGLCFDFLFAALIETVAILAVEWRERRNSNGPPLHWRFWNKVMLVFVGSLCVAWLLEFYFANMIWENASKTAFLLGPLGRYVFNYTNGFIVLSIILVLNIGAVWKFRKRV